jgi:hypothetical protein
VDIYERLTRMLTPIGGSLLVDAFMDEAERARRVQREGKRRMEEPVQRAQVAMAAAAGGESVDEITLVPDQEEPLPPKQSEDGLTDTGKLRLEVQEFMSRENAHHAEDDEIAEFMKERSGFDPSEMK